jgi:hypothetical protein
MLLLPPRPRYGHTSLPDHRCRIHSRPSLIIRFHDSCACTLNFLKILVFSYCVLSVRRPCRHRGSRSSSSIATSHFLLFAFFGSSTISPLRQTDHQKSLATNIYPVWARSHHLDPILAATLLLLRRMWTSFRGLSNGHGTSFLIGLLRFVRALEDERLPPFVCF